MNSICWFFDWSPPQLERYNELKELSLKRSAVLCQQAEKLEWELKADHEQMALDQRRKKEVEVLQVALLEFTDQMIIVSLAKDSKTFYFLFLSGCQQDPQNPAGRPDNQGRKT